MAHDHWDVIRLWHIMWSDLMWLWVPSSNNKCLTQVILLIPWLYTYESLLFPLSLFLLIPIHCCTIVVHCCYLLVLAVKCGYSYISTAHSIPHIVIQVGTCTPSMHEAHFQFTLYINYPACVYFSPLWILTRLIPLSLHPSLQPCPLCRLA